MVAKTGGLEHRKVKRREEKMGKMLRRGVGHTIREGTGQGGVQAKAQRSGLGPGGWWGHPEIESGRKSRFGRDTKVILRCSGHKGSRTLGGGI